MVKETLHLVGQVLPKNVRDSLKGLRARMLKDSLISQWEKKGRPLPPPHAFKQWVIEQYKEQFNYSILVETGTFFGDMIEAQKNNFEKLYSVELSEKLWKGAVSRFSGAPHIEIIQGDSGQVLGKIMEKVTGSAIFWLDGHYSNGVTARGETECPIFGELDAIFRNNQFDHVLLIDDARCFNGENDYPTIEALTEYLHAKDPRYKVTIADDIIRCTVL